MRKFTYLTASIFILGFVFLLRPYSLAYAYDITTDEPIHSISGDFTQQDLKDFMTMTSLAQEILDGGQLDFSQINTPIAWLDFVDGFTTPILEAIDDAMPIDTNLSGVWERLNEAQIYYWDEGIVQNLNGNITDPLPTGVIFKYLMRSQAQKDQIGTSVGETILNMAKDVYDMAESSQIDTYLPQDYLWFLNVNNLYFGSVSFDNITGWYTGDGNSFIPLNNPRSYSYFIQNYTNFTASPHIANNNGNNRIQNLIMQTYLPKISIYYDTTTNTATYSASSFSNLIDNSYTSSYTFFTFYYGLNGQYTLTLSQLNRAIASFRTDFPDFNTALNYFYNNFFNIDFYVDNVPWIISDSHVDAFKFGGSTVYEGTTYPLGISIPDFHSFDFDKFKSYIIDAINHSSVLMYTDIADCFLDINGQTCVATYNVIRNDYDNLVTEQFNMVSYPRFNSDLYTQNLVDQFRDDTQAGVAIIKNSYDIIPTSLSNALLYCGLLILFGLIIRRFLE